MLDDVAKTRQIGFHVTPEIVRVPPEMIAFTVPRGGSHTALDCGDVQRMKRRQAPSARPQETTGRNILWMTVISLKGLRSQDAGIGVNQSDGPSHRGLLGALRSLICPRARISPKMGDAVLCADCQMLSCKLIAREHDRPQIDTARIRQFPGSFNIRFET